MAKLGGGLLQRFLFVRSGPGLHGMYDRYAKTNETVCEFPKKEGHQRLPNRSPSVSVRARAASRITNLGGSRRQSCNDTDKI